MIQLLRALDKLHVLDNFNVIDEISPLAHAKLKKEQRARASTKANKTTNKESDLGW